MAPVSFPPAVDGTFRRLLEANARSIRALPESITKVLAARQSPADETSDGDSGNGGGGGATTGTSGTQTTTLTGGAIAGIVIGSIAGILLLWWIIRSCQNMGNPGGFGTTMEPEREKPRRSSAYYDPPRHRSRSRHSGHHHHHHHSRSPRRVEVIQPVAYAPRGRSPQAPAAAYYGGRSSHDGRRRSSDARRYSGY
ncbi:hypothetical protein GGS20DRAFT_509478 [Poronia punctata]|nr:hypothetical protein GGS20DRAFT_509478 [Poronia punctata]